MAGFSFGSVGFVSSLGLVAAVVGAAEPAYANAFALRRKAPAGVAYAGPCVRLFNPTSSAGQDIGFAGNAYDTATHNTAVSNGFTKITTWYDQSGNLRHATQTDQTLMPNAALASLGGQPALRLDVGLFLAYNSPSTGAAARSLLVAYANQAPTTSQFATSVAGQYATNSSNSVFLIETRYGTGADGHPYFVGYGVDITDNAAANTLPLLATAAYDGAVVYLRRNRAQIGTNTAALVSVANGILNSPTGASLAANSQVLLGEVLATVSYVPAIITQLETDLSTRFGL